MRYLPLALFTVLLTTLAIPAGAQQLQCSPCNRGFGHIPIGTSNTTYIYLTNTASRSLTIRSKTMSGAAFSFGNFPVPQTLAPGKTVKLPLIFTPTAAGQVTGTVTIGSNANNSQLSLALKGTGVAANLPQLGISPSSLNFGNVTVGTSASLQTTLTASNGAVTISTGQVNNSEFTLQGVSLPLVLQSGQSVTGTVTFTPTASGQVTGTLTFVSSAGNSPTSQNLTGTGVAAPVHSVSLSWSADAAPVVGYNAYRGNKSGGPYSQINNVLDASTSYTDNNVTAGATYYYVVTAVDASGNESLFSNEVQVVVPYP